ncbi:MAG: Uma2 family endonuclease, partial [Pseudonocardiales bacterium]|nr:Uma2 family endonuclease [Pseudonocardiales bacterium]
MATGMDAFGPVGEFTVADLERMPDDGLRYELLDGTLLVSRAPGVWHQEVAFALARALHASCPPDLHVVLAPFEWRGSHRTALQPDVLVARRGDLLAVDGGRYLEAPPVLAVEVLSPSTRRIDRLSKLSAYEEAGVASYWLIDPDPEVPSLHALDLVDGHYVEVGCPSGAHIWQAQWPFPVDSVPRILWQVCAAKATSHDRVLGAGNDTGC